jgi:MraZ protein
MFRGTSFHTIDSKGRIIIPARFRDFIRNSGIDGIMISTMDSALFAYTFEEWNKIESKILSLVEKSPSMRRFRRLFVGGAFECSIDKQDRFLIPPSLRQDACLEKEIVLIGVLDHFEIWSRDNYEKEKIELEKDLKHEEVINDITRLGL